MKRYSKDLIAIVLMDKLRDIASSSACPSRVDRLQTDIIMRCDNRGIHITAALAQPVHPAFAEPEDIAYVTAIGIGLPANTSFDVLCQRLADYEIQEGAFSA